MGIIDKNKKFERKVEHKDPNSRISSTKIDTNKFDIDEDTIKNQQNKK